MYSTGLPSIEMMMSPGLEPRLAGGLARVAEVLHQHAADLRKPHVLRVVQRGVAHQHAERGAIHPAVGDELIHDPAREIDRHGEAVAGVEAGLAGDRGVHPDDVAADADERPARVAGIDRRVGLDEVLNAPVAAPGEIERAPFGADDARGDGEGEVLAQRIAHGQHPLAHPGAVAVAEGSGREIRGVDLQHRDVGRGVGAHQLRLELAPVQKPDREILGAVHHVGVGQDVAVTAHDEARSGRLADTARRRAIPGKKRSKPGGTWSCGRGRASLRPSARM